MAGFYRRTAVVVLVSGFAVGGCGIMPATGPYSADVRAGQADPKSLPYALVKLTPEAVDVLARSVPRLAPSFADRSGPTVIRFGIGDVVSVTIFEAAAGGLFIPLEAGVRPGNFITLPNQAVDNLGNIYVPYAGAIRANGRTVVEVQQAIVDALKNRALEPQAVVALAEQHATLISVLGDVRSPVRYPASASGERVLDAITRAGGPSVEGYDSWVILERHGKRAVAPFGALIHEPSNNVYVRPQDTIYVFREPQTFVAFGAHGTQGQFTFDAWRLSLSEAVAKAGGLNDNTADPASVFVYRGETREVAAAMGVDCTPFSGPVIPVIYNVNFRDPAGYFLATKFEMRNKDIIYTSDAVSVEATKFMTYLLLINATVNAPITTAISAYSLKALVQGTGSTTVLTSTATPVPAGH